MLRRIVRNDAGDSLKRTATAGRRLTGRITRNREAHCSARKVAPTGLQHYCPVLLAADAKVWARVGTCFDFIYPRMSSNIFYENRCLAWSRQSPR